MSAKRCAACAANFNRGRKAYVPDAEGKLRLRIVCLKCEKAALAIVLPEGAPNTCRCGASAVLCAGCATGKDRIERAKALAGAVKKLKGILKAYESRLQDAGVTEAVHGRIEGLEQAVNVLEKGDW